MSNEPPVPPDDAPKSNPSSGDEFSNQPIRESIVERSPTARVPERWTQGRYSTGQIIHDSPKEFAIDFLHGLTRPFQVVARVVVTPDTMDEFIRALRINLDSYTRTFGPPPTLPPIHPPEKRPTVEEIYDMYKLPDDMLSGSYANQVLIGHSPSEFFLDFITGFYPHPAVSSRVYIAAGHTPRFLSMLENCMTQYRQRHRS